ncbi:hypothetical protein NQ176_g1225 [Zarea fungicola]|uniref:Uncharacterized protein n=1 Tax=Zarea fungicola TaxID=93591 RepID=A0ACC1NUE4_9HYPO|nr:hypothetical protein NQ176_g1225 [Lecanicillium fungicola]
MRILSLLSFLPLLATAQVTLPENALEGLALHLQDDAGNITYIHESEFQNHGISILDGVGMNSTNLTSLETRGGPGDNIVCDTPIIDIEDVRTILIVFADYLGCGSIISVPFRPKFKNSIISYYQGSAVVYICNYASTTDSYTGPNLVSYLSQAFTHCGETNTAAWYYIGRLKESWGYTNAANWFCGPPN